MKVLFDHNVPRGLRRHLSGHEVIVVAEMGWATLENGKLLQAAADAGFEAVITMDKKIEHEQNLSLLPLPVVVINALSNALPACIPFAPSLLDLLNSPLESGLFIVESDGKVCRKPARQE